MSFSPLPCPAAYQAIANSAAGLSLRLCLRVRASISFAPCNMALISIPCRAAATKPTGDNSEVLPPTQSRIGKIANQPSRSAIASSLLLLPVMAKA